MHPEKTANKENERAVKEERSNDDLQSFTLKYKESPAERVIITLRVILLESFKLSSDHSSALFLRTLSLKLVHRQIPFERDHFYALPLKDRAASSALLITH